MKICITARGDNLEAQVDPRFGRCSYFIIVDPETMDFKAIPNTHAGSSGGAGIQSGQLVSEQGASSVLTGNVGPNAFQTLKAAKLDIITGISGSIRNAIENFKAGNLNPISAPDVESHFGMKGKKTT